MTEPIFPIKPPSSSTTDTVMVIEPYRHDGAWVFDDAHVGLKQESFVADVTEMIHELVEDIPDAATGFRLHFAMFPFEGHQAMLRWVRSDPVEGNWYRSENGSEGWLCPALFWY